MYINKYIKHFKTNFTTYFSFQRYKYFIIIFEPKNRSLSIYPELKKNQEERRNTCFLNKIKM